MPKKPLSKKTKILFYSLVAIIILFFLLLRSCGFSGGPLTGKVIDDATGKPIAGAIVVARWEGHLATFAHGKTVCYHVASTTTNEKGRYYFPIWFKRMTQDWQKNVSAREVYFSAYKKGYQRVKDKFEGNTVYLEPFVGGRVARFEFLLKMLERTRCPGAGKSTKNFYLLYNAFYEEAESLAVTEREKKSAKGYKQRALDIRTSKGSFGKTIYKPE